MKALWRPGARGHLLPAIISTDRTIAHREFMKPLEDAEAVEKMIMRTASPAWLILKALKTRTIILKTPIQVNRGREVTRVILVTPRIKKRRCYE